MLNPRHGLPGAFLVVIATTAVTLQAQEALDEILKKATISPVDTGTMQVEVSQRLKSVFSAAGGPSINTARDRLVKPAKAKEASKAGLEAYVDMVSGELQQHAGSNDRDEAMVAVLTLEELDHIKTVEALMGGLQSKHPSVRYRSAQALGMLRPKLKDDAAIAGNVIATLGKAGGAEKDEQVLRKIYWALNFKTAGADAKLDGSIATALNEVLAARARSLAGGSRDEYKDEEAIATAAACYGGAGLSQQSAMLDSLYTLMRAMVDHYFDANTAAESLPVIGRQAQKTERTMYDMIRASKSNPPAKTVSDFMKTAPAPPDRPKAEKQAEAALEELRGVLRGDPWKLP